MSGKWEKTFEIAVPVERVWEAVTNRETLQVLLSPPQGEKSPVPHEAGEGMEVVEAIPLKKLRWIQGRADLPEKAEFTIVFESRENGSAAEKRLIQQAIEADGIDQLTEIKKIIESTGALEYTAERAQEAADRAIVAITGIPGSEYKESLIAIADFAVKRRC